MTETERIIRAAFEETPAPPGKLTSLHDDEGVSKYFSGTHWDGHSARDLRGNAAALSFFEPDAFRYYLPAFMLAELKDPETADIIAEGIAFNFQQREIRERLLPEFSSREIDAILAFLRECAVRYSDGIYDALFLSAAEGIEKDRGEQNRGGVPG